MWVISVLCIVCVVFGDVVCRVLFYLLNGLFILVGLFVVNIVICIGVVVLVVRCSSVYFRNSGMCWVNVSDLVFLFGYVLNSYSVLLVMNMCFSIFFIVCLFMVSDSV